MKHVWTLLLAVSLLTAAGCGNNSNENTTKDSSDMVPANPDNMGKTDTLWKGDSLHRDSSMVDTIARKRIPMN